MAVQAQGGRTARGAGCATTATISRRWRRDHAADAHRLPRQSEQSYRHDVSRRASGSDSSTGFRREVIVVMDEAYAEYVEDPEYPDSIAAVSEERPLLVLRTFSKIYGLAGLRSGTGSGHRRCST